MIHLYTFPSKHPELVHFDQPRRLVNTPTQKGMMMTRHTYFLCCFRSCFRFVLYHKKVLWRVCLFMCEWISISFTVHLHICVRRFYGRAMASKQNLNFTIRSPRCPGALTTHSRSPFLAQMRTIKWYIAVSNAIVENCSRCRGSTCTR